MDDVNLVEIVKQFVKELISEILKNDSISQSIANVARKLIGNFNSVELTIKVDQTGKVTISLNAEIT
jgi:hypothetical protein